MAEEETPEDPEESPDESQGEDPSSEDDLSPEELMEETLGDDPEDPADPEDSPDTSPSSDPESEQATGDVEPDEPETEDDVIDQPESTAGETDPGQESDQEDAEPSGQADDREDDIPDGDPEAESGEEPDPEEGEGESPDRSPDEEESQGTGGEDVSEEEPEEGEGSGEKGEQEESVEPDTSESSQQEESPTQSESDDVDEVSAPEESPEEEFEESDEIDSEEPDESREPDEEEAADVEPEKPGEADDSEAEDVADDEQDLVESAEAAIDDDQAVDEETGVSESEAQEAPDEVPDDDDIEDRDEQEPSEDEPSEEETGDAGGGESDDALDDESTADEGEDEGSIKDMLEEESERTQEEEESEPDEEDEEELPEGYITVEQLPEEEEFEVPSWIKNTGYALLGLLFAFFCWSYLLLPMWENYHSMTIHNAMENERYEAAEDYLDRGLIAGGAFIHYPDRFTADFLGQLLRHRRYDQFERVHERLTGSVELGPWVKMMYVQYLLHQGRWQDALDPSEQLQFDPDTRGFGYLFHGKASLQLGNISRAETDLNSAQSWLEDNPGVKRLRRDIQVANGEFEDAQQVANRLRSQLNESEDHELRVRDYLQLARINARLNRHRVAEDMLTQALEVDPNYQLALKELTFRYLLQDRLALAEPLINGDRTMRSYRRMYPADSFGWWSLAELNLSRGNVGSAITQLERARDLNPRNPEVHRVLGVLHLEHLDAPREATQAFQRARNYGLGRLKFIQQFARANYRSGEFEEAVELFQLLREHLDRGKQKLTYNLGSAYLGAGQYDRASELLNEAFEAGYVSESMYNQRGLLRELRGDPVDAQAMFLQGKEWATENQVRVSLLDSNLERSLAGRPPEPLTEWMAPLDTSIEIEYWRQLDPSQPLGNL